MKQLKWVINDAGDLYRCFIPFIERGGLFIPTAEAFTMGETVELQLDFLGKEWRIEAPVVWMTPDSAVDQSHPKGVGLQFQEEHQAYCGEIDTMLVGYTDANASRFVL